MEPLATTPQPLHSMVLVLFVMSFVLLAASVLLGQVLNWILRRRLVNGAAVFFWLLLALVVGLTIFSFIHDRITLQGHRIIGQATAALAPSLALAFFLERRYRKKIRAAVQAGQQSGV